LREKQTYIFLQSVRFRGSGRSQRKACANSRNTSIAVLSLKGAAIFRGTAFRSVQAISIGSTVNSMSKEALISKRGGHPARTSHDAARHGAGSLAELQIMMDSDPLDLFDALLPVCEEPSDAFLSQFPAGVPVDADERKGIGHSEGDEIDQMSPDRDFGISVAQPKCDPDNFFEAKPMSVQPLAHFVSRELDGHSLVAVAAAEQVDLIASLRDWESKLHRTETELQQKANDLAARRRDLSRQVRAWRRDIQRPTISPDAQNPHVVNAADSESRLAEMQSQIERLVTLLRDAWPASGHTGSDDSPQNSPSEMHFGHDADTTARLNLAAEQEAKNVAEIESLRSQLESLVEQNNQLATELAHLTVQRTVDQSSDATASMSWEERKALLYRQFESEDDAVPFDPEQHASEQCVQLNHEMACMQKELRARDSEIAELRSLLEQRPEVQDNDLAVGAAAITRLFDDDELIREERARLKEIQAEWETKFRDMEIAASIARASLARERRQLECQNAELEEQLAHLKQELRQESIVGPAQPRRWFAKLGLGD